MRGINALRYASAVLLLILVPIVRAQHYAITDLGTLPGDTASLAWGMNSSAMVVGGSAGNGIHGFFWTSTSGLLSLDCGESFADAINDNGQVVGSCGPTSSNETAFLWTLTGGMQNLGRLPGSAFSGGNGINDAGQVVGTSNYGSIPSSNYLHAFLWTSAGGMEDLGTLPGGTFSLGNAINGAGQIVGYSGFDSSSGYHAFVWTRSRGMQDLGALPGGTFSEAGAINDFGQIVGSSDSGASPGPGNTRAVLWTGSSIRDLGLLPGASYSFATSINNAGQIVGESGPRHKNSSRAVIWGKDGHIRDLNTLICRNAGWVLLSARAINAMGQIAEYGTINGQTHAFLGNPSQNCK
jgi:probable HAF family extracellular repeat protein